MSGAGRPARIGIVGTGNMGRAFGLAWATQDHEVRFGARRPEQVEAAVRLAEARGIGDRVSVGTNDEAAVFGEVILWSVRDTPPVEVLADAAALAGRIVVDVNNTVLPDNGDYRTVAPSLAETLAVALPDSVVVKAFNTITATLLALPPADLVARSVAAFVAADDPAARATVSALAQEIGLSPVDCGALRNARVLEGLADHLRLMFGVRAAGSGRLPYLATMPSPDGAAMGGQQPSRFA